MVSVKTKSVIGGLLAATLGLLVSQPSWATSMPMLVNFYPGEPIVNGESLTLENLRAVLEGTRLNSAGRRITRGVDGTVQITKRVLVKATPLIGVTAAQKPTRLTLTLLGRSVKDSGPVAPGRLGAILSIFHHLKLEALLEQGRKGSPRYAFARGDIRLNFGDAGNVLLETLRGGYLVVKDTNFSFAFSRSLTPEQNLVPAFRQALGAAAEHPAFLVRRLIRRR
ncbi:MAG: hypothetical protein HY401_03060 [Elusimicrobia bacterium]|nr:hypothetical protein [Elusimicrobiota bacterium]